jgi:hypothetical protein
MTIAHSAHPPAEDHDLHDQEHDQDHHDQDQDLHDQDQRPHACYQSIVYVGHLVEEDGDEVEEFAQYLCRRCAGDEA